MKQKNKKQQFQKKIKTPSKNVTTEKLVESLYYNIQNKNYIRAQKELKKIVNVLCLRRFEQIFPMQKIF